MLLNDILTAGDAGQTALIARERQLSYAELAAQVGAARAHLTACGVAPGDRVALISKNSAEFVMAYLAVVSLGATIVPINFLLVPREIAYIVKDAGIRLVLTAQPLDLAAALAEAGVAQPVRQILLDEARLWANDEPPAPPQAMPDDTVAALIYTSGTTGHPKGAMLTHNNLMADANSFLKAFPLAACDRVLCVLPMYHCFAWTCAVLAPLARGASVLIQETFAIRETLAVIREAGITAFFGVPAMFQLFITWGQRSDFEQVRLLVSGGAPLPQEVANQFRAKMNRTVVEGYGLSEASPVVAVNPVEKVKTGSVGLPLPDVAVRVLDEDGQELARGEIGELVVRGPNVMQGYYNLPEETARALRDGWLHTGDLAYQDDEGYIFIVDRLKDMIITGGENIYPREIEELLHAYPGVTEAAVIGVPDKLRGHAACAYLVLAEGQELDKRKLRDYLSARLASYKVPKDFYRLESLPKNPTGKILKRVLRDKVLMEKPHN